MATIHIPDQDKTLTDPTEIRSFLSGLGVEYDQWQADTPISAEDSQDAILSAYDATLKPYMKEHGYQVADVINIHPEIENYADIRAKFLAEHTHTEDEVRFFVSGEGLFWFNIEGHAVFNVRCQQGDLLGVPKDTKHWFDAGKTNPNVTAIRIFIDPAGWVPHYTGSGIDERYPG